MMNLPSALSVCVGLTFAFEILFGPKLKSCIPFIIRYFILSSAQCLKWTYFSEDLLDIT
jgi:hypothetical protein